MADPLVELFTRPPTVAAMDPPVRFRTGEVTDATVSPPLIQVGASDTAVACPTMFQPVTGDFVAVLTAGGTRVAVGPFTPRGWQHIDFAQPSAVSSFSVTIPSGIYDMVRFHIVITGSVAATFLAQVNGDSTAGLHRYVLTNHFADNSVTASSNPSTTTWQLGAVSDEAYTTHEMTVFRTVQNTSLAFQNVSAIFDSTTSTARASVSGGSTTSNRLLSSMTFSPGSGTVTGRVITEGYVLP